MFKSARLLTDLLLIFPMFYRVHQFGNHLAKLQCCKNPKFFPHDLKNEEVWNKQFAVESINRGECFITAISIIKAHKAISNTAKLKTNTELKLHVIDFEGEQQHCWIGTNQLRYDVAFPNGITYLEFKDYFDHVLISKSENEVSIEDIYNAELKDSTSAIIYQQWVNFIKTIYHVDQLEQF